MSEIKIAIIGAGPAGCTLARLLLNASMNVTIFEGEASRNARTQGGTLDLHDATGLAALKRAGLYDEFLKYARFDGEAIIIANKHMKRFVNMGGAQQGKSRGRPEIDRDQLRSLLLDALPTGTVKWAHRLRSVGDDGTLHFDHGIETGFDLIIGADGAWSKVRPLLTPVKPYFSGIGGVRLTIANAAEKHPGIHKLVNRGSLFANSDNKGLTIQQLGDGSITMSSWTVRKEDWIELVGYDLKDPVAVKKAILKEHHDWAPELRAVIEAAGSDEPWAASLYMLPIGHRWAHKQGFTLLGDAAHLATPFAGEGVNLAMEDAMHLADAIIRTGENKASLSTNIKAFEENMFIRATKTQQRTQDMMQDIYFTEGSPDSNIEVYLSHAVGDGVPWFMFPVVKAAIYAYFWWFRWWNP